jgi:hypothetical protein
MEPVAVAQFGDLCNDSNVQPLLLQMSVVNAALAASPAELLQWQQSQELQSLPKVAYALVVVSLAANGDCRNSQLPVIDLYTTSLLRLLSMLVSAHKQPKDWRREGYCCSVTAVLDACSTTMRLQPGMRAAVTSVMTSDVLKLITTAQAEVTLLLRLQQQQSAGPQQQQQQSAAAGQASQQQQQEQQQQQRLVDLSVQLLRWCLAAKWLWSAEQPSGHYGPSFQLRAVEHAAALACQLDHHATNLQRSVVLSVVGRVLQKQTKTRRQVRCQGSAVQQP